MKQAISTQISKINANSKDHFDNKLTFLHVNITLKVFKFITGLETLQYKA